MGNNRGSTLGSAETDTRSSTPKSSMSTHSASSKSIGNNRDRKKSQLDTKPKNSGNNGDSTSDSAETYVANNDSRSSTRPSSVATHSASSSSGGNNGGMKKKNQSDTKPKNSGHNRSTSGSAEPDSRSSTPQSSVSTNSGSSNSGSNKGEFSCRECPKTFTQNVWLQHHIKVVHEGVRYRCTQCECMYSAIRDLRRHYLAEHIDSEDACVHCNCVVDRRQLFKHQHVQRCCRVKPLPAPEENLLHKRQHQQTGAGAAATAENINGPEPEPDWLLPEQTLEQYPLETNAIEPVNTRVVEYLETQWPELLPLMRENEADILRMTQRYWSEIRTHHRRQNLLEHVYNFNWNEAAGRYDDMLTDIYEHEREAFRINGAIGVLLQRINPETQKKETKYFYPDDNEFLLFERPLTVFNSKDLLRAIAELSETDLAKKFEKKTSQWKLVGIVNIRFYVNPLRDFVVGCGYGEVNETLSAMSQSRTVSTFLQSQSQHRYKDNLCFFRCLAKTLGQDPHDKRAIDELFERFRLAKHLPSEFTTNDFDGLAYTDLVLVERVFNVAVCVYHQRGGGKAECWYHRRVQSAADGKSVKRIEMNLDISRMTRSGRMHYSLINNMKAYAKRYICENCRRPFRKNSTYYRHLSHCPGEEPVKSKLKFCGGVYTGTQSLFERLDEVDVHVAEEMRRCPYVAVFDFESILVKSNEFNNTFGEEENDEEPNDAATADCAAPSPAKRPRKLHFVSRHQPVSFAATSNVPRFEEDEEATAYGCNESPERLVEEMLVWLRATADRQYQILADQFRPTFEQLNEKLNEVKTYIAKLKNDKEQNVSVTREQGYANKLESLRNQLDQHCRQLKVLGFNCKRYDLLLIKRQLFPSMVARVRAARQKLAAKNRDARGDADDMGDDEAMEEDDEGVGSEPEAEENSVDSAVDGDTNNSEREDSDQVHNGAAYFLDSMASDASGESNDDSTIEESREASFVESIVSVSSTNTETSNVDTAMEDNDSDILATDLYENDTEAGGDDGDADEGDQREARKWPTSIVHNGSMVQLNAGNLCFLDASNYLAAGSSLDKFLEMYNVGVKKAPFPYEYLDSFERLTERRLPDKRHFYSSLKDKHLTDEEYAEAQRYWRENRMRTFGDYLEFYNKRDVDPFLQACLRMSDDFWSKFRIDIYREAISLPGVTARYLARETKDHFALFRRQDEYYYRQLKDSITGGLSLVMRRHHTVGETFIRNNEDRPVRAIRGFDANGLYLWAQAQPTPAGYFDIWERDERRNGFRLHGRSRPESVEWLDWLAWRDNVRIRHRGNGREKCLGVRQLPVDGYCEETRTVYEYYGCYYHYCRHCPEGRRAARKQAGDKAADVVHAGSEAAIAEKEKYLADMGYRLETVWGCKWRGSARDRALNDRERDDPTFRRRRFYDHRYVKHDDMRDAILNGDVFGFAKVDITTPDHLKEQFADFPPIIKNVEVHFKDIGEHMQEYAKDTGQMRQPRRCMISSYQGEGILLLTPVVKYLVEHGLILERIHYVLQYDERRSFTWFRDVVTENRLRGDGYTVERVGDEKDEDERPHYSVTRPAAAVGNVETNELKLAAETFKLLGNTGYGKMLTNKERHVNVKYCDYEEVVQREMLNPLLKRIKCIDQNCYEVHKFKKQIVLNLPIVIGLAVYGWAKLRMMQFAYDFLGKYFDKRDYEWMETDTDSAYLALSHPDLRAIVKPELREEFDRDYYAKWFVNPAEPYTSRQPGLFKTEFEGTSMVCLCSKTYMAVNSRTNKQKTSTKGLQSRNNKQIDEFRRVLDAKKSLGGENMGFIARPDNNIWTYVQNRMGLSYLYIKRRVMNDGISTEPLEI